MHIAVIAIGLPFAFTSLLLYVLPSLARHDQFFAVTVRPSFRHSEAAQRIVRAYRVQVLLHAALGFGGLVLVVARGASVWLVAALLWPALGSMVAVALAHRSALQYAVSTTGIRRASLQPRPRSWPGGSVAWIGPFVILGLAALYGHSLSAAWSVVGLPYDRASAEGADPSRSLIVVAGTLALVSLGVVATFRARRIETLSEAAPDADLHRAGLSVGDNSDDGRWLGGLLYFNPDDPAVFVEKRVGLGYGLNFGNPRAWGLFGAILLIPVAIVLLR